MKLRLNWKSYRSRQAALSSYSKPSFFSLSAVYRQVTPFLVMLLKLVRRNASFRNSIKPIKFRKSSSFTKFLAMRSSRTLRISNKRISRFYSNMLAFTKRFAFKIRIIYYIFYWGLRFDRNLVLALYRLQVVSTIAYKGLQRTSHLKASAQDIVFLSEYGRVIRGKMGQRIKWVVLYEMLQNYRRLR